VRHRLLCLRQRRRCQVDRRAELRYAGENVRPRFNNERDIPVLFYKPVSKSKFKFLIALSLLLTLFVFSCLKYLDMPPNGSGAVVAFSLYISFAIAAVSDVYVAVIVQKLNNEESTSEE
jgi:hypothetical protein